MRILGFPLLSCLESCLLLLLLLKVILPHLFPAFSLNRCRIVPWGPQVVGWIPGIVGYILLQCLKMRVFELMMALCVS
jgi:hypothetical protein